MCMGCIGCRGYKGVHKGKGCRGEQKGAEDCRVYMGMHRVQRHA